MLINKPIKGEKTTIVRPIALKVMSDLRDWLEIGVFDKIRLVYLDEEGVRTEKGSTVDTNGKEGIYLEHGEELITATVEENYDDDHLYHHSNYSQEFKPLFNEPITGTHLSPHYTYAEMRFTFTYRAQSKAVARGWLNSMKSKIRSFRTVFMHNLEYHFQVDDSIIYALTEVHRLIKNADPNTPNVGKWMREHFSNRFGTTSDAAGINTVFTVTDIQQAVVGQFDFSGQIEEGDKIDGGAGWMVSFSYFIRYLKPTVLSLHYPRVVYNQVVPKSLMGDLRTYYNTVPYPDVKADEYSDEVYFTQSGLHLQKFSSFTERHNWQAHSGVVLPRWNEFIPEQMFSIKGTMRFVDQLVLMDKEDDKDTLLMDLMGDNEFIIDENLRDFLIAEGNYLLKEGESVFQIMLYRNGQMLRRGIGEDSYIRFEKGQLILNKKPDLKYMYNIRIALYYDWTYVSDEAILRLLQWKDKNGQYTLAEIFGTPLGSKYGSFWGHVGGNGKWSSLIGTGNGPLGKDGSLYERLKDYLRGGGTTGDDGDGSKMNGNNGEWGRDRFMRFGNLLTVQTFFTENYRKGKEDAEISRG